MLFTSGIDKIKCFKNKGMKISDFKIAVYIFLFFSSKQGGISLMKLKDT